MAKSKASDIFLTCLGSNSIFPIAKEVTSGKMKVVGTLEERAYYVIFFLYLTNVLSVMAHSIFILHKDGLGVVPTLKRPTMSIE